MTIFPWLFISGATLIYIRGPRILFIAFIDFGLAIIVAVGLGMQGVYLPATEKGCSLPKAEAWQIAPGQKSFFVLAAELGSYKNASEACKSFVSNWTLGVSCIFFQMLAAYVGIFFDEREQSILNPWRPFFYFVLAFVGPPVWIKVQTLPRIRFAYHYVTKTARRTFGQKNLEFIKHTPYICQEQHFIVSNHKLQEILSIEHVLLNVVDYLCYEDVINFSLSSKAVREAMYPSRDMDHRIPKLKKHCCETVTKKSCLYCNKKICESCKKQQYYPGLPGRRHVTSCQPYCPRCYYNNFARHPRGYKRPCKCRTTDRSVEFQDMCRTCYARDREEMQTTRHRRYQQEARDIAEGKNLKDGEKVKCGSCKKELKSGMRFWVCGRCKGECRDRIHPPYVKPKEDRDVEKGEEESKAQAEDRKWSTWFRFWTG